MGLIHLSSSTNFTKLIALWEMAYTKADKYKMELEHFLSENKSFQKIILACQKYVGVSSYH